MEIDATNADAALAQSEELLSEPDAGSEAVDEERKAQRLTMPPTSEVRRIALLKLVNRNG